MGATFSYSATEITRPRTSENHDPAVILNPTEMIARQLAAIRYLNVNVAVAAHLVSHRTQPLHWEGGATGINLPA